MIKFRKRPPKEPYKPAVTIDPKWVNRNEKRNEEMLDSLGKASTQIMQRIIYEAMLTGWQKCEKHYNIKPDRKGPKVKI